MSRKLAGVGIGKPGTLEYPPDMNQVLSKIAELLRERGWTLTTAESCTGGLVSGALTSQSGSSAWFVGGVVAYANPLKTGLLGVDPVTLATAGAVSAATATAMAQGARAATGADCAIAITGIAGPTGGTADKPVGLVFIGIVTPRASGVFTHHFSGTRDDIRAAAVAAALGHLREALLNPL